MKRTIIVFIIAIFCLESHSQHINPLDKSLYRSRVKLVDEFMDRFNGEELHPEISKEQESSRHLNLMILFNSELFKSAEDEKFIEAEEMADSIESSGVRINYSDSTWFAKAICHGKLNKKEIDFTLYLAVERRAEDMFKWVITRAVGETFKLTPSRQSDNIMLMPDDHETNFMSLYRITTEKDDYITNYACKDFQINQTSVFYSLVYYGLLDIEYVEDLEFIFFQVPNYIFSIKNFHRDTRNAGWLISSFEKMTEEDKSILYDYMMNKK